MIDSPLLIDVARQVIPRAFVFDASRYLIAACLVAGVVWLLNHTSWRARWIQPRRAKAKDYLREVLTSMQTVLVYSFVGVFTVWAFRNGWMARFDGDVGALGFAGMLAAIIVAHDAYFYWSHRAMHHPKLFKLFHRTHHRTVTPTPFAAYAFAIPEAFIMAVFMPLWLWLVPTPNGVTFAFLAIMILRNCMGHAGLELHPRGWVDHPVLQWISTTTHHDMHHSGGFNRNYGFYFTFWDRVMGTEHPDYAQKFREVTATPAKADTPRFPGQVVMGAFAGLLGVTLAALMLV